MSKKAVLFGGNFDPPTLGHMFVASKLVNSGRFDELWFIPTGDNRYDRKALVPAALRAEMLEAAVFEEDFGDNSAVRVSRVQSEPALEQSRTIDLIRHLKQEHQGWEFSFAIGADRLASLPSWAEFDELCDQLRFVVIPRSAEDLNLQCPDYAELLAPAEPKGFFSVSSSEARGLLEQGKSIAGVVPSSVQKIIEREGLYSG